MFKLRLFTIALFLVIVNHNPVLSSDIKNSVEFNHPEGFIDQEFNELQKAYINPRNYSLKKLKQLPINEMSDQFIHHLINEISTNIESNITFKMIKYLDNILEERHKHLHAYHSHKKESLNTSKPQISKKENINSKQQLDKKLDYNKNSHSFKILYKKESAHQAKATPLHNKNNIIRALSFMNNSQFININNLSTSRLKSVITYSNNIKYLDISLYVKNIKNQVSYLIRRYNRIPMNKRSKSYSINYKWVNPSIPYGQYKFFAKVQFFNASGKVVDQKTKYWGSKSNKKYIIFKN